MRETNIIMDVETEAVTWIMNKNVAGMFWWSIGMLEHDQQSTLWKVNLRIKNKDNKNRQHFKLYRHAETKSQRIFKFHPWNRCFM